ncbi:hypothetical protein BaRGS_00022644 [Batillaria attramentaria]|uniref:Uncharacterized protein n=1 Tax=Batillaria attramentaria TaxID=370345 RepID=A0ABD0KGB6_9CAEN
MARLMSVQLKSGIATLNCGWRQKVRRASGGRAGLPAEDGLEMARDTDRGKKTQNARHTETQPVSLETRPGLFTL